jgi:hypothetical protein
MAMDKVIQEMDSIRRVGGGVRGNGDVDQALSDADSSVRSLNTGSDVEAVHDAWRAVARAETAVKNAIRVSTPRRRIR